MDQRTLNAGTPRDYRTLSLVLARYRKPDGARGLFELAITAVPFVLIWIAMWAALDIGYWICLLLALPAAGFLVRLFMIQHDCGHGAFFRHRHANDWLGRVIGVFTLTPYDFWRKAHAIHHASSGCLDRRGIGDIDTLTVREFLALSTMAPVALPLVPAPVCDVRDWSRVCVCLAAPAADGNDARRLAVLAKYNVNKRRDHYSRRWDDLAAWGSSIPARATANYRFRRLDWRVAVLRPAPVRGYLLGQ